MTFWAGTENISARSLFSFPLRGAIQGVRGRSFLLKEKGIDGVVLPPLPLFFFSSLCVGEEGSWGFFCGKIAETIAESKSICTFVTAIWNRGLEPYG